MDKEDRRQSLVRLTPKGRRVLAEIKDRCERHVAETLAPLKTRECVQLMTALGALARVLAMSEPEDLCAPRVKRR